MTRDYIVTTTISQMANEGIEPFTLPQFVDFWMEGEIGEAIRDGEINKADATALLNDAWGALPETARA